MRKALPRLACPACLGVALEVTTVTDGAKVHHCKRCGGTWLLRGQVARLRTVPASALRLMLPRADEAGYLCHGCAVPMERDAAKCASCGWGNTLECPDCGKPMRRETENGVTVDVCRGCQAVWLDHHELSMIWASAATVALAQTSAGNSLVTTAGDAGGFLLDALWYAPDLTVGAIHVGARAVGAGLDAAADLAGAGMNAVANSGGLVEAAGGLVQGAAGMAEVAGDAAGGVFSFILEIIGGIFDGLG